MKERTIGTESKHQWSANSTEFFTKIVILILSLIAALVTAGCNSESVKPETQRAFKIHEGTEEFTIIEKISPPMQFFATRRTLPVQHLKTETRSIAKQVATTAIKRAKLKINGPLVMIFQDLHTQTGPTVTADIGFPVSGKAPPLAKYSQKSKGEFKSLSLFLATPNNNHASLWKKLYKLAAEQDLETNGESRTVIKAKGASFTTELQLGIH